MSEIRERIIDAAMRLLETDPAPAMSAVAQAAGVSRATLYRRFPGSDALWEAVRVERAARAALPIGSPRERILRVARRCFSAQGLAGTPVQQLAAQAHVALATLYTRFGDKAGVLTALVDEIPLDGLRAAAARAPGEAAAVYVPRLVAALMAAVSADAGLVRLLLSPEPDLAAAQARARARTAPIVDAVDAALGKEAARQLIGLAVSAALWGGTPEAVSEGFLAGHLHGAR